MAQAAEVWCVLSLLDAANARGFTVIVRAVQSSEWSVLPLRVRWTGSFRLHADLTTLAKLACELARARAVPLTP